MPLEAGAVARLRSQVARGSVVLFTGAGFSRGARDRSGRPIASVRDLREALYGLLYPGGTFDEDAGLADLYAVALKRDPKGLRTIVESRLGVDSASLPEYYRTYFAFPWQRVYTLNIDDLDNAVARRFPLPIPLRVITAVDLNREPGGRREGSPALEVVHLNGSLEDPSDLLTFSEVQYGERLASTDPWYARCAVDLRARPVIFIGTELRESTLWQHMALRQRTPGASQVPPPGGILVSPTLSPVRAEMLSAFNIDWYDGDAEQFARDVLDALQDEARKGFVFISSYRSDYGRPGVPLVNELAAEQPRLATEYLLGNEPHWSDLLNGRVVVRTAFDQLAASARQMLAGEPPNSALAVTGTAGSGKSTALMWLALDLSNTGLPVFWIDRDSAAAPTEIRRRVMQTDGKVMLAIDDADMFGAQLVGMLKDLVPGRSGLLFAFAVRSGKLDDFLDPLQRTKEVSIVDYVVPDLTDADIDGLIDVLDRNNRLGILKGASQAERRKAFSQKAGRQLLVAMIEATTGEKFEEKVTEELDELRGLERFVYALLAVASSQRHFLTKDEVMLAAPDAAPAADALARLVAHHLVGALPPHYQYRVRHRVVADIVLDHLQARKELKDIFASLAFAAASKVESYRDRRSRGWRLLVRVINHDLLLRVMDVNDCRTVYEVIENLLSFDYHYWLQRGSLEVEAGDLRRGEQFLGQALSMGHGDHRVDTEYGYLLMKKAAENPHSPGAAAWLNEGLRMLEGVITARSGADSYPYHIVGAQGLAWVRHGLHDTGEKQRLLAYVLDLVDEGLSRHPLSRDLSKLRADIQHDLLMTTVPRQHG